MSKFTNQLTSQLTAHSDEKNGGVIDFQTRPPSPPPSKVHSGLNFLVAPSLEALRLNNSILGLVIFFGAKILIWHVDLPSLGEIRQIFGFFF